MKTQLTCAKGKEFRDQHKQVQSHQTPGKRGSWMKHLK